MMIILELNLTDKPTPINTAPLFPNSLRATKKLLIILVEFDTSTTNKTNNGADKRYGMFSSSPTHKKNIGAKKPYVNIFTPSFTTVNSLWEKNIFNATPAKIATKGPASTNEPMPTKKKKDGKNE